MFERQDYIPDPPPPTRNQIEADVRQKFTDGEYHNELWELLGDHPFDAISVALWHEYGIEENSCAVKDFRATVDWFLQQRVQEAIDYYY